MSAATESILVDEHDCGCAGLVVGRMLPWLASLQTIRSAMDAERAPGGAGPQAAQVVSRRLSAYDSSLYALRSGEEQFS